MSFWGKKNNLSKSRLLLFFSSLAVTFLKHWKQKNAEITHRWDLMEFEEEEVSFHVIEKVDLIVHLFIRIDLDQNSPYVRQQSKKIQSREFSNPISLLQHVDIELSLVFSHSV
jgi:hypothetical protein